MTFYYVIKRCTCTPVKYLMKVYGYLWTILIESWIGFPDFRVDFVDFWISEWISGFQIGFLDFTVDFWISGFQLGFLDFSLDFWISQWISGFQFGFLPTVYEISFVTDPSDRCHKILGPPLEWGPMGPHIINIMGPPSGFWGPL